MQDFNGIKFKTLGADGPFVFWGHGWGQSHAGLLALCEPLAGMGKHVLVDFPGFGESAAPSEAWGTEDYADQVADLIRAQTDQKIIWVGHSFGCRVGLQLAARHPGLIAGLFLIAGAGLKRKRPLWQSVYFKIRIAVYKFLKRLIPLGLSEDWLKANFGSADYKSAGAMRDIFIKVVNEDLSEIAKTVPCPVHLVYGEHDTETPPEIGERLSHLIPGAKFALLKSQDHYSVLSSGRHPVTKLLKDFIQTHS